MSSNKRPDPLAAGLTPRPRCPVCGEPSYSREGAHPQCLMEQSDKTRMVAVRAAAAQAPKAEPRRSEHSVRPWHRRCDKCGQQSHIRKPVCACGHEFAAKP